MGVKLTIFAPPAREHPRWIGWAKWACSISRTYTEAAALLGVPKQELLVIPREDRPLGPDGGSVPVVWTTWGWLKGTFRENGVFEYECQMNQWEGEHR